MIKNIRTRIVLFISLIALLRSATITWDQPPSIRSGQIETVVSLMTAEDNLPSSTDSTWNFVTAMAGLTTELQYGLSLASYQSWMTDTFSFNISMVSYSPTGIVVRFLVLDNTFFSKAKVHYIVVRRTNSPDNTVQYDMQVVFGCYLTVDLYNGTGIRTQSVGNQTAVNTQGATIVIKSMIAGLQLSNSLGKNNYVKVQSSLVTTALKHVISVQNNNYLKFMCLTTVITDSAKNTLFYYNIIEYSTFILNATNPGLSSVPYSSRYDGLNRMFFGISQFNLSMSDTRYLNVEASNISLVSLLYDKNSALNQVTYETFFFAYRYCDGPPIGIQLYYNPLTYDCAPTCPAPLNLVSSKTLCQTCHYSCDTCDSVIFTQCTVGCTTTAFRTFTGGNSCPCNPGYFDPGVKTCLKCDNYLIGCLTCTDAQTCTLCNSTTYIATPNATTHKCDCLPSTYFCQGFCLPYPGCIAARLFLNNIVCDICNSTENYTRVVNSTCICNYGFKFNATTLACQDKCGDSQAAEGYCDDGGHVIGDGCDAQCNIEPGWHCTHTTNFVTGINSISTCQLKTQMKFTYLYSQRFPNSNHFKTVFSLSPQQALYNTTSLKGGNFNTTLQDYVTSQNITYDPLTSTIIIQGDYTQDIEGTQHIAYISFQNLPGFYADPIILKYNPIGINAQLIIQKSSTQNSIIKYIIIAEGFIAVLLAIIASVVGLKLIGIELLLPVQLIYFSLSTINLPTSYVSSLSGLKFSNGYNNLQKYSYSRTYSQNKQLIAIQYETQFLLSTNIMIGIFIISLLWLFVHHLRLRYKQHKLQKFLQSNMLNLNQEEKEKSSQDQKQNDQDEDQQQQALKKKKKKKNNQTSQLEKQEYKLRSTHHRSYKIFGFEVDRFYFIFFLILLNQVMFGFIVMTLNTPISTFIFAEQINVLVCNFFFFIYVGNFVFISYDQESNKMIAFTCIKDRYAYLYLIFDFIMIVTIGMTFMESFSIYLVTVLSLAFVVLVVIEKPYYADLISLENLIALYLQIMLVTCLGIFCYFASNPKGSQLSNLVCVYIVASLIFIGQVLTTIRIAMKVNFKKAFDDLVDHDKEDADKDKKHKKVIQKNLDLLAEQNQKGEMPPSPEVKNGLFTPKDRMIDWESRNTEEYQTIKMRQRMQQGNDEREHEDNHEINNDEQFSELKPEEKLDELDIIKKRLRNNLRLKKEAAQIKKDAETLKKFN